MQKLRTLALAVGDALAFFQTSQLTDFPLPTGSTFEELVGRTTRELEELTSRTRKGWKRQLLELVQRELGQAIEKARLGDEDGSHRLFVDAEIHFRQYERGDEPRVTFIASADGELVKTKE